jgi:acyl-CoA thioesterase FadM
MAKLSEHPNYPFSRSYTVRVTDVNYGGHLGNDSLVGLLQQARIDYLAALGASEIDLGDGAGIILTELIVSFRGEAFLSDTLTIGTVAVDVRGASFRLCHAVRRGDELIALAEIRLAAFDYAKRSTVRLPKALAEKMRDSTL